MLNINEFKSAVHKYDLERPNLFAVEFSYPDALRNVQGVNTVQSVENGKLVTLFCKGANLPGINLALADNLRYGIGPNVRMPVRGSLNDVSLTFLNDAGGRLHTFFQTWIGVIYPQSGREAFDGRPGERNTYLLNYKTNYETGMKIIMYGSESGKTGGSSILQTIASVASAAAGVPFLGSLLGSRAGPQHNLKKRRTYVFKKMYPTNVSDISLSSSAGDSVTEFTVGFTYQTFYIEVN